MKKFSIFCSVGLFIFREKLFFLFNIRIVLNFMFGFCVFFFIKLIFVWLIYLLVEGERERYLNNWEDIFCLFDKVIYMYIYIVY